MAKTTKTQEDTRITAEDRAFGEQAAVALEEAMAKTVIRQQVPPSRRLTAAVISGLGGGLGKTTVAQIVRAVARARDGVDAWKLIRIDNLKNPDDASNDLRADLEIRGIANAADVKKDGRAAFDHYDVLGMFIFQHNTVWDHGSNVEDSVAAWLKGSPVLRAASKFKLGFDANVLADTETKGLKSALSSLKLWHETLADAEDRRLFLILNDRDGIGFPAERGEDGAYDDLMDYADEVGADIVRIAHGKNRLLDKGKRLSMSMMECWHSADEIGEMLGWTGFENYIRLEREKEELHAFLNSVTTAVLPILPPKRG